MRQKDLLLGLAVCAGFLAGNAHNTNNTGPSNNDEDVRIVQKIYPQGFDNYSYGVFFYNDRNIYTVRGNSLFNGDTIDDVKINPSYTSLATLQRNKKGKTRVSIYDINPSHRVNKYPVHEVKMKDANPTAIAYSPDAKQLAVGSSDKQITIINPISKITLRTLKSNLTPRKLAYSDNNYYLAVLEGNKLEIWNQLGETIRKTIEVDSNINDFAFSNSSSNLIVLTANGKMNIYDTKSFDLISTIDDIGKAKACWPNNTGKYVAVVDKDNRICVINTLDPTERHFREDSSGGISHVRMVFNNVDSCSYLLYNSKNAITFHRMRGLAPFYNKMMTTMLNERLNMWMKQQPGESMEDYRLRVNEESRIKQAKAMEREIATKMATGLLEQSTVTIGKYNVATNSLELKFNSMPTVFLPIAMNELNDFTDTDKLEFRNAKYSLNSKDKFELVYVEVFNPVNGKTYIYDNMERQSLSYMNEDSDFVPLEIIQKSNMEETSLIGIKEDVISLAQQENVISDKTHIFVKTEAVNAVNADGEKIVNYNVGFTYEVEEEFSARDDFKPGHYHTEESAAAMLMLKIMTKAFEKDFAKYIAKGKRVKIQIKGTADASPINRALAYDGKYGEYVEEPVYKNKELNNITLSKKEGIADNEQLAFARAIGVQHFIEKEISAFGDMNRDYEYHIEVAKEAGSQFRRISVQYTFINAF